MTLDSGRIYTGDELTHDLTTDCDVCVIGSGAGGGWLAAELAARGRRVVMLEEGGYRTRRDFNMKETRAFATLYQELGVRTTDDLSISMLQGRCVGGGTTINWCSSFRAPDRVLALWRGRFGLDTLSPEILAPHWDAVERRLHVAPAPEGSMNENNRVLWDGLGKLNYTRALIPRNVHNCANLGACGMGCPLDAKQSTLATVIPDAVERGLTLVANASARTLEWTNRNVREVRADVLDPETNLPTGRQLTIKPKVTVVSGGAINSPALLLRSGLDAEGRVGRRTWLHPVAVMIAQFDREIRGFQGAPQSVSSHHFIDRGPGKIGFFLEVPPIHPMLAAIVAQGSGGFLQGLLADLPRLHAMIAVTADGMLPEETGATVRLRDGAYSRHSVSYEFVDAHWEAFREACKEMARIQFAAGARRVFSLHLDPVRLDGPEDLHRLDDALWQKLRLRLVSAHQMGGCAMGKDPSASVVDPTLRFHTMDNLFVVDGSVFPTSLGVNPQQTIYGLGRWAAAQVEASIGS
jgi:choline dehydrogenase-like flavoprotein